MNCLNFTISLNDILKYINILKLKTKNEKKCLLIGISGIPGSGKTSLSNYLIDKLIKIYNLKGKVIPLDGYHIKLKNLNPLIKSRRGCIDSFDLEKFKKDMFKLSNCNNNNIYSNNILKFPSFNHSLKDPIENNILIDLDTLDYLIIEGLYLYTDNNEHIKDIISNNIYDLKLFINYNVEKCMERVIIRNFNSKVDNSLHTIEDYRNRINNNDRINSKYIIDYTNYMIVYFIDYID